MACTAHLVPHCTLSFVSIDESLTQKKMTKPSIPETQRQAEGTPWASSKHLACQQAACLNESMEEDFRHILPSLQNFSRGCGERVEGRSSSGLLWRTYSALQT